MDISYVFILPYWSFFITKILQIFHLSKFIFSYGNIFNELSEINQNKFWNVDIQYSSRLVLIILDLKIFISLSEV